VITPLACSLVGQQHPVSVVAGTRAAALYGADSVVEAYYCNYGVNPDYLPRLRQAGLSVSGLGEDGEARIVELPAHPFFLATLFLPQTRSTAAKPHPLLAGYAAALAGRC
jgi:CTP synthase (UTP-ammonia lyase)